MRPSTTELNSATWLTGRDASTVQLSRRQTWSAPKTVAMETVSRETVTMTPPIEDIPLVLICSLTARRSVKPWATLIAAGCRALCPPTGAKAQTTAATSMCPAWTQSQTQSEEKVLLAPFAWTYRRLRDFAQSLPENQGCKIKKTIKVSTHFVLSCLHPSSPNNNNNKKNSHKYTQNEEQPP